MRKSDEILRCYVRAVNNLDDYFEYSNESERDRVKVKSILDKLNSELAILNKIQIEGEICKRS